MSSPEMPHMAGIGAEGPGCICPAIAKELFNDPLAHKAVCLFGQWLEKIQREASEDKRQLQNDPINGFARSTNPAGSVCPCKAIIEDEAKSFEQEASGYPAGSKENQVLLMHAEYLRQLSARTEVRRRFSQAVQS